MQRSWNLEEMEESSDEMKLYRSVEALAQKLQRDLVYVENGCRNQLKHGGPYQLFVEFVLNPDGSPMYVQINFIFNSNTNN